MHFHKNLIDRAEVKETFFLFCWMQSTWQLTSPAEEDISIVNQKNICFLVDHWKDESASGKLHKGNDIYISNVFFKLITRFYICPVTPPPWTYNFVPTPPNVCWTIPHSQRKKLRYLSFTGCDETGSMLSRVALWGCLGDAIASFIGCWKVAQKLGQNASQNSPTMQFHATRTQAPSTRIRLCLETEIFPPSVCEKIRVHK